MTLNNFNSTKQFNILHWNANGITNFSNLKQFEYLLEKENIQIASLNETFFKENHRPFFNNFYLYRNDRTHARGGGVALLVRRSLQHKLLPLTKTTIIENLSIEILINQRRTIISTAYSPRYTAHFSNDIMALISSNKEFILLGDLNAKHTSWNCPQNNISGIALNNLQQNHNFFVYCPNSHTLYPHQRNRSSSTVDIALSNSSMNIKLNTLGYEIPSDHRPILCSIECSSFKTVNLSHYSYKHANWRSFQNLINNSISLTVEAYTSKPAIDKEINKLINLVLDARESSVPKYSQKGGNILEADVIRYIGERKKFNRKSERATNTQEISFYDQCSSFLSGVINQKISKDRNNKWTSLLTSMKPGDKRFWTISRSLRGKRKNQIPHLMEVGNKIISDSEKADILANTFAKSHILTMNYSHSFDNRVISTVNNFKAEPPTTDGAILITFDELSKVLSTLKTSKSPGFDNVPNILLKKLPDKAIKLLVILFNSCINLNYFPTAFKNAKVVAINKPNKPKHNPSSYRPISLLSNLGKLYEKLIHFRLYEITENLNIIPNEQFGFRKEHSTVHQISRIKNKIESNKRNKKSTGLLLLDIEKAFDTIWHHGLIFKLITANTPKYLCKIIADFLENRTFRVSVNTSYSSPKSIPAGVPQGSVLSPLLYTIYTSDFKPPKLTDTAYYADDTALITSSKLTSALIKKMEKSILACNKFFRKWKIKINNNKTQAIIFPYNKSPKRLPTRSIKFESSSINIQNQVKYLGVYLDKKLRFRIHIESACDKAIKSFRALWPILNRRSALNITNKNLIFKSVIRPILSYASPIWYKAANCHLKRFQIIQNKCLKMIHKKHWRYSTSVLHEETGYEMFNDFITRINTNYFSKIEYSCYPTIRECRELP